MAKPQSEVGNLAYFEVPGRSSICRGIKVMVPKRVFDEHMIVPRPEPPC